MTWLLLFIGVPLVDLALLLFAGGWLGPWPTFLIVVLTGILGSSLARREGFGVLRQVSDDMARGLPPATRITEGALIVAGGVLLLTPGFLTDAAGFALILPPTRRAIAPSVLRWIMARVTIRPLNLHQGPPGTGPFPGPPPGAPRPGSRGPSAPHPAHDPFDHPVS